MTQTILLWRKAAYACERADILLRRAEASGMPEFYLQELREEKRAAQQRMNLWSYEFRELAAQDNSLQQVRDSIEHEPAAPVGAEMSPEDQEHPRQNSP